MSSLRRRGRRLQRGGRAHAACALIPFRLASPPLASPRLDSTNVISPHCLPCDLCPFQVIGDADFCLVARTDARGLSASHGLEDAVARANLYVDAGADGSLVEAPRSVDELRIVGEKTKARWWLWEGGVGG